MLVAAAKLSSERRWWRARWPLVCIPRRRLRRSKKENQSVWQTHPPLKHSSTLSPVTSFIQQNWQGRPHTHTHIFTHLIPHALRSVSSLQFHPFSGFPFKPFISTLCVFEEEKGNIWIRPRLKLEQAWKEHRKQKCASTMRLLNEHTHTVVKTQIYTQRHILSIFNSLFKYVFRLLCCLSHVLLRDSGHVGVWKETLQFRIKFKAVNPSSSFHHDFRLRASAFITSQRIHKESLAPVIDH